MSYFLGDGEALGRRFGFGRGSELGVEIIGVVRDGKTSTLREEPRRFIYLPFRQTPELGEMTYYVRSAVDEEALFDGLRRAVHRVDAALPVTDLKTMRAQIVESLFLERLLAALSVAFSALATLLAAFGLYGVTSHAVALRTREIGIRLTLGAERRQLLRMVLRDVAALVSVGIAVGLPAGYAVGRGVESQLFGLSAFDPFVSTAGIVVLTVVALAAGYFPAARASRVDPIVALRHD